jgi:pilus assembly protein CpaC
MRLNGRLLPFLAAAAIGFFLVGTSAPELAEAKTANAGVSASVATQRVKLGLNKSVVIDLPSDAYDILVANPAVADAVTRTARRIYLFGKAVGETNIFVFGPNGEQIVSLDPVLADQGRASQRQRRPDGHGRYAARFQARRRPGDHLRVRR